MNSEMRKAYKKSCVGKKKFKSMGRAQKAAYSYLKTFGKVMNGYKCDFCDGFHIGGR